MCLLGNWFNVVKRDPCPYQFMVEDITEINSPDLADLDNFILNEFANSLLIAHVDPGMLREECRILLEELDFLDLKIIKDYVEGQILPANENGIKGIERSDLGL
jgi:hypothetical protein